MGFCSVVTNIRADVDAERETARSNQAYLKEARSRWTGPPSWERGQVAGYMKLLREEGREAVCDDILRYIEGLAEE